MIKNLDKLLFFVDINSAFEEWWETNQKDRMIKSKYLAKKVWIAVCDWYHDNGLNSKDNNE